MRFLIPIVLLILFSCQSSTPITIVDIGSMDRTMLGLQIEKINKMNPRVLALDIFFYNDSLEKDMNLERAFSQISNGIQVTQLLDFKPESNQWDSIQTSHPKFNLGKAGYANLIIKVDRILDPIILLQQYSNNQVVSSFCYVIAESSYGVKKEYQNLIDKAFEIPVKHLGKGYEIINLQDLLSNNFDSDLIKDRIVMLGNVAENEDFYYVNSLKTRGLSGVEIHASYVSRLIDY